MAVRLLRGRIEIQGAAFNDFEAMTVGTIDILFGEVESGEVTLGDARFNQR